MENTTAITMMSEHAVENATAVTISKEASKIMGVAYAAKITLMKPSTETTTAVFKLPIKI